MSVDTSEPIPQVFQFKGHLIKLASLLRKFALPLLDSWIPFFPNRLWSKRLHQLQTLLRCRLTQELCLMWSLALWALASLFSSSSPCFAILLPAGTPPWAGCWFLYHYPKKDQSMIRSTKLLRWDLPSVRLIGKTEYRSQRLKERSSSTGNWVFSMHVSRPIWPRKSAALIMMVMIKTKLSSSCLKIILLGQQHEAGKENRTYFCTGLRSSRWPQGKTTIASM